jgi:peptide/nickel transport system permease protein
VLIRYIGYKLLSLVIVLLGMSLLVFFIVRLVPGDVVTYLYGLYMSAEQQNQVRALFGLDRPLWVQYFEWLGNLLQGNFGRSLISGRSIGGDILLRLPVTAQLAFMSALWSIPLAVGFGLLAARFPYGRIDGLLNAGALIGLATPGFWLASLLVLTFAVSLHWLPAIGYVPFAENPIASIRSLVLPSVCMGVAMAAAVMRMTRSAMLQVLSQEFVRTARAKGLGERPVVARHALRNALIPIATLIGAEIGRLLGGSLIIEQIFAIPGIGQYAATSILTRDYPVLQGTVLVVAGFYVVINTLVDISYAFIDPRVRLGSR